MNCDEWPAKVDLFLDRELPPAEEVALAAHLGTCESCAQARESGTELKAVLARAFSDPLECPPALAGLGPRVRAKAEKPRVAVPDRTGSWKMGLQVAGVLFITALPVVWFFVGKIELEAPTGTVAEEERDTDPRGEESLRVAEGRGTPPSAARGPDPERRERQEAALALNREAHRLAASGRTEEAIGIFERITIFHPESFLAPRAEFAIAGLVAQGDSRHGSPREGARRFLDFATRRADHPLADDAELEAAKILARLGEVDSARASLVEILEVCPGGDRAPEAAWELGRLEEKAGNREEALRAYRFAIDAYPDSPWAARALERVNALEEG